MLPTQRGADSTPGGGLRSHMPCIMAKIKKKKQLNYLEKHHGLGSNDRSQQVWTSSASPPGDHHSWPTLWSLAGFPGSLAGKESACNAGDSGSIPELGRCPGDRIGYPLQYSWASLVVQLVKNLSAMQETWVWSLGWKDPLEKGTATYSRILAWRIPWTV